MAKIHVLADEKLGGMKREFIEVGRKAKVGEKVIVFKHSLLEANGIFSVDRVDDDGHIYYGIYGRLPGGYRVLVPVEEAVEATADNPESMLDLIANLARRVTELEKTVEEQDKAINDQSQRHMWRQREIESVWQSLRGTQDNVEMLDRELERVKHAKQETDAHDLLGKIAALLNEGGYGKCE
jgi:prefoldin subunit 5